MKLLHRIVHTVQSHWVGDGFPVRNLFSYKTADHVEMSPFLLLDYAGPADFPPALKPRGVGLHPQRGFEAVTLVYQGEIEHRDSVGNSGLIGPDDVQWMTVASGLLHEEMHSTAFSRCGGTFEATQLWINLPSKYKREPPHYQTLAHNGIPTIKLDAQGSRLRVIAGAFRGVPGPARTYTPIQLWDLRLQAGTSIEFDLPQAHTTLLFSLKGTITLNHTALLNDAELAVFERKGKTLRLTAHRNATLLIMSGEPIDEPITGYGPFVMNTSEELRQALTDFDFSPALTIPAVKTSVAR